MKSASLPGRADSPEDQNDCSSVFRLPRPEKQAPTTGLSLADRINAAHEAAHGAARTALEKAAECGGLLLEAKASVAHGEWLPWVAANLSFGDRQARKYMRLARHAEELPNRNSNADLTIDSALKALAEPSDMMRLMGSSASAEWCTPPHIVERVVATLGEVDLDPSWHPESPVLARTAYTIEDDGLSRRWSGRVYLNPPYGREIGDWIEKLVAGHEDGAISEAITLVPARVDIEWFRRLDPFPRCFVYGRLTFGSAGNAAPFPCAIVYLGANVGRFAKVFGPVGGIWARIGAQQLREAGR